MDARFCLVFEDKYIKKQIDAFPHDCKTSIKEYFQNQCNQIILDHKDSSADNIDLATALSSLEDEFKRAMRCISLGLKFLFEKRTFHGDLSDPQAIFLTSTNAVKLILPKEKDEDLSNIDIKKAIKKDLSVLKDVVNEIQRSFFKIGFPSYGAIEKYVSKLVNLSKDEKDESLDIFIKEVAWLMDYPLFYSTCESLDFMDKVHMLVIRSRVIHRKSFDDVVWKESFSSIHFWRYDASCSSEFCESLTTRVENGGLKYSNSACDMIRLFRNSAEHHTLEPGLEGLEILFERFIKIVGPITPDLRDALKMAINNQRAKNDFTEEVANAMICYLDSKCQRNKDTEVCRLLVLHNNKNVAQGECAEEGQGEGQVVGQGEGAEEGQVFEEGEGQAVGQGEGAGQGQDTQPIVLSKSARRRLNRKNKKKQQNES